MPHDHLAVDVFPVNSETAEKVRIEVTKIGVSELEEQLAAQYGQGIPNEERAKRVSSQLLASMTALSTDEQVWARHPQLNLHGLLSRWLDLAKPMVDDAHDVSDYIDEELTDREQAQASDERPLDKDFTYTYSVLHLSSFVIAGQAGIEHPSSLATKPIEPTLVARRRKQEENRTNEQWAELLDAYEASLQMEPADKRRLQELRLRGREVVLASQAYMPRIIEALRRTSKKSA